MNANGQSIFSPRNVACGLALLLALEFYAVLFGGQTFYYRDFGVMSYPAAVYHRDCFWKGEMPLWNPYSNCGAPFLAQWGTIVLYPLNLIYLLLPLPWSLNFFCVLHLWIGGMGMYLLARDWVRDDWSAAAAAVLFTFNGVTLGALTWSNYTAAVGLFPWVVWLMERAWTAGRENVRRAVCWASLAAAMQLLAGAPELSLFTWICVLALWIHRLVADPRERTSILLRLTAVVLLVAGLTAAQMLPFFELLRHSQRAAGPLAEKWPLPPWGWANFILPRFHTFKTPQDIVGQYDQAFISSTYLGAACLMLAAFGLRARMARVWILGLVALGAATLSLGSAGHLYPLLLKVFPFLGIARYPVKFLFLLSFTLPLLAGFGLRELSASKQPGKSLFAAGLIVSLLMGALAWFNFAFPFPFDRWAEFKTNSLVRWMFFVGIGCGIHRALSASALGARAAAAIFVTLLIAFDGMTHLPRQNPTIPDSVLKGEFWQAANTVEKPAHGQGRVFITPEGEAKLLQTGIPDPERDMITKRLAQWSHLNLIERVPKVNGSSTLQLREQAHVQAWLYGPANSGREAWLDFLNVTLRTASNSIVEWDQRPAAMPFLTAGQKSRVAAPGGNEAWPAIDFRSEVLLHGPGAEELEKAAVEISDARVSAHEIQFKAKASARSYAVIPQSWHPAWKCEVAGRKTAVLRANLAFQAVAIPAGESEVRLYYRDDTFRLGAVLSGLALAILCVLFLSEKKNAPLSSEKSD